MLKQMLNIKNFKGRLHPKGFTLIELLIVVAIIAILVGIGATRYQAVIQRSRDSERKSALRSVATALEQYYGDRSNYPEENTGRIECDVSADVLDWGQDQFRCDFGDGFITYSGNLPEDPQTNSGHIQYYYEARDVGDNNACSVSACQRYILATELENDNDPERVAGCLGVALPVYNFCVHNP